jgi:hypothetical protein
VKTGGWSGPDAAREEIRAGIAAYAAMQPREDLHSVGL